MKILRFLPNVCRINSYYSVRIYCIRIVYYINVERGDGKMKKLKKLAATVGTVTALASAFTFATPMQKAFADDSSYVDLRGTGAVTTRSIYADSGGVSLWVGNYIGNPSVSWYLYRDGNLYDKGTVYSGLRDYSYRAPIGNYRLKLVCNSSSTSCVARAGLITK